MHDDEIDFLENDDIGFNSSESNISGLRPDMPLSDVDINSNSVEISNPPPVLPALPHGESSESKRINVQSSDLSSLPKNNKPSKKAPPRPKNPPNFGSSSGLVKENKFQKIVPGQMYEGEETNLNVLAKNNESSNVSPSLTKPIQCDAHPLSLHSSDDDDDDEKNFFDMHDAIPKTYEFDKADDKSLAEASTKESTGISSVIFDAKARTQLFSTWKKNIQLYTGSGIKTAQVGTDSLETGEKHMPTSFNVSSQRKSNTDSFLFKNAPELRKRSSSENNFAVSDEKMSNLVRSTTGSPRSSSVAMSFSSLLAERKRDHHTGDSVSIDSKKLPADENKNMSEQSTSVAEESTEAYSQRNSFSKDVKQATSTKKLFKPTVRKNTSTMPIYFICFLSYSVFLYFVLPLPLMLHIVISSFLFGVICSTLILCVVTSHKPQPIKIKPPYASQPVPHQIPKSVFNPNQSFKGWMNQIEIYDPDSYHVNATRSVFVTLEEKDLRLQTPNRNIPRRAVFGEASFQLSNVVHSRVWDLSKAKVYLVPDGLVKKRVWSKKYPICIEFIPEQIKQTKSADNLIFSKSRQKGESKDSYDIISDDDLIEKIYLFGRTQRQKEEWFYRFQRAIYLSKANTSRKSVVTSYEASGDEGDENDIPDIKTSQNEMKNLNKKADLKDVLKTYDDYYTSMCRLLPDPAVYTTIKAGSSPPTKSAGGTVNFDPSQAVNYSVLSTNQEAVVMSQPRHIVTPTHQSGEPGLEVAWFNVVVGRIMFDFLRRPKWANWLSSKIQKKLEKIRLPYFMEGLKLTEMNLGTTVPLVHKISLPRLDSQGIWLDMDITYNGAVQMTLETKMVLTKLGKKDDVISVDKNRLEGKSAITNSDEEDSAESSDDDESLFTSPLGSSTLQHFIPSGSENLPIFRGKDKHQRSKSSGTSTQSGGSSTPQQEKRWVRIVDSITKSKYFQKATENSYIKKKLETVSNTPLILMAELHECQGTICINIPPPPSDRVWYGFKDHPHMLLKAHPKLGERAVTTSTITDWIEKKLAQEFNKVLLMPNMDDIPIPLMFNNLEESP